LQRRLEGRGGERLGLGKATTQKRGEKRGRNRPNFVGPRGQKNELTEQRTRTGKGWEMKLRQE